MLKKISKISIIVLTIACILSGCGKKQEPIEADLSKTYTDNRELKVEVNESGYILTNPTGYLALYSNAGEKLDELQLEQSNKSDFIYCEDSGDVFSKNILNIDNFNCIFYAVDRGNGRVYLIKNEKNKLKLIDDKSLKESKDIEDIKAYNGMFYYMVKGDSSKIANSYTVAKSDSNEVSGLINNMVDVPVMRRGKTYTYIYVENFSSYYLDALNLSNKLDSADISNMNLVTVKKDTFKLPYDISDWTITNNEILFTAENVFGKYDMLKNILEATYGPTASYGMFYVPGRYSKVISISQLGGNAKKIFLYINNVDTMENKELIEIMEDMPIDSYYDVLNDMLYIICKEDSLSTYGKLKIIDLTTLKEVQTFTFDFVPTSVAAQNGKWFVFNEYEDFYATGFLGDKDFVKADKYINGSNTRQILICRTLRKDHFTYDANGRYIAEDGKLLDYRGNYINEYSQKINKYGQLLDAYGRAINAKGELVDKYGNIIDENGIIIQYTIQKDGYYRSATGKIVDETGKAMIQNEDGSYSKDIEEIPPLQWHYDENGEVVIDADYLEKYPDARSWIDEEGNLTLGVSAKENTNESEKQEVQENKSIFRKLTDKIGITNSEDY